jgi:hypothetical protein
MQPNIRTTSTDQTAKLRAALAELKKARVLVGVPEAKTDRRKGNQVTNAGLMYIHTHGSPLHNLPARPVIEPAIQAADNKALITKQLGEAAKDVLAAKPGAANAALTKAGMLARNAVQRWFVDPRNGWPANSPETIARKGSDRPLIDTAQLRRSIQFLVQK